MQKCMHADYIDTEIKWLFFVMEQTVKYILFMYPNITNYNLPQVVLHFYISNEGKLSKKPFNKKKKYRNLRKSTREGVQID